MSNSAVLRGKVSRCKSATEFPRKCGRCVKIERQNFLGKIVAATDFPRKFCRATKFPSDRISCDTGVHKDDYGNLASGDSSFMCPSCSLAEHRQLIRSLVSTVECLKEEIGLLKAQMQSRQSNYTSAPPSEEEPSLSDPSIPTEDSAASVWQTFPHSRSQSSRSLPEPPTRSKSHLSSIARMPTESTM